MTVVPLSDHPLFVDHGLMAAIACGVQARSSHWAVVEKTFLTAHPTCLACGAADSGPCIACLSIGPACSRCGGSGREPLNIHHVFDFHEAVALGRPDLELDPRNLCTLCRAPGTEHHLLLGHLDDWQSFNPDLLDDVKTFGHMAASAIRADERWIAKKQNRPLVFSLWDPALKDSWRTRLDATLPPDKALCDRYGFTIKPYEAAA